MGMVALPQKHYTPDDVRRLPDDGNRYECIGGELLVTPSPRRVHQAVLMELCAALMPVREVPTLRMLWSPADIELRRDALTQPDLFVFPVTSGDDLEGWSGISSLALAIEVLSPSTARYDRLVKRRFYQDVGVPEYWIVDADARLVERWRPGDERPEICAASLEWLPPGANGPIIIDLPAMFAAALDR